MDKDQYLQHLLESIGHHQMADRDGECRCVRCWQGWPCDAALAGRELAVSQGRVARLEKAIVRALAGCPFCQMGHCRADAHNWLAEAMTPPEATP